MPEISRKIVFHLPRGATGTPSPPLVPSLPLMGTNMESTFIPLRLNNAKVRQRVST